MFTPDPDYDTSPEPEYEGMSWYEIVEDINEYHREQELEEAEREMMRDWFLAQERGWFRDY